MVVSDVVMSSSLWHSICQQKYKVFFWLLLQDRLNTRGLLRRKHMHLESYTCELCLLQKEERLRHLFLAYPFAKKLLGHHWNPSATMDATTKSNKEN
jgi:hypothetical protein